MRRVLEVICHIRSTNDACCVTTVTDSLESLGRRCTVAKTALLLHSLYAFCKFFTARAKAPCVGGIELHHLL